MSNSETIQKSDIGDDDVFEIQREFRELKEEKKAFLSSKKSENNIEDSKNNSENVLTGIVTEMNNVNDGQVELVVEYVDNNQEKHESFCLDKPQNKDEFDVNNKFVRIVNFFGDRKGDPSSLKFRDIWLEKRNGHISIDVPDNLSLKTKMKKTYDRKLEKYVPNIQITNLFSMTKDIIPTFITLTGILVLFNIFASYGLKGGTLISILGLCASFIGFIIVGLLTAMIFGEDGFDKFRISYCVTCLTISLFYVTGNYDFTYELGRNAGGQVIIDQIGSTVIKSFTNILLSFSPSVLFGWSVMGFDNPYGRLVNNISERYRNLKLAIGTKYRSMKGVEYVKN